MGVKSIIDIDVNDSSFKAFVSAFTKFDEASKKVPKTFKDVNDALAVGRKGWQYIVDQEVIAIQKTAMLNAAHEKAQRILRGNAAVWKEMGTSTAAVAGNIASATVSLLKWTALTSVFSGLLGAGGLFGIDRLAGNVSAGRRSAQGTGVSYGEQKAFGLNFDRLVDSSSFLSSVNEAQHDVTKRPGLISAGFSASQIDNKDSAQLGSDLLTHIKSIVDTIPAGQMAQELQARKLDQFISLQDAQRIKNTSPAELARIQGSFQKDSQGLGLDAKAQSVWQDFSVQMSRAGDKIENVFVKGLEPLIGPLGKLSEGVTEAVKTFLEAPKLKEWIEGLGTGLKSFAETIASPEFQGKVKDFAKAFMQMADIVVGVVSKVKGTSDWLQSTSISDAVTGFAKDLNQGFAGGGAPGTPSSKSVNNPGNLRPPGSSSGFMSYSTEADGYKAMAKQLSLYANRDKLDTVTGMVSKWAPPSENDTQSYISDVAKRSGLGATDKIDMNNQDQVSRLIAAMAHHENSKNNITPDQVRVQIYGAPGGNVITSAQQTVTP